jgi:hypothetical protein
VKKYYAKSLENHLALGAEVFRMVSWLGCEPGNSVSIVGAYGLEDWAIEVRFPAEAK